MQENLTIARPYAQAAFAHAQGEGSIPAWSDALAYLSAVVSDDDMRRVISDPRVGRQRAVDLLLEVGGAKFTGSFRNFVKVLSASHRLGIVPEVAELFEEQRAAAENVVNAEVVSAYELEPHETQRIASALQSRLKKEVRVAQRVEPDLIGGAVVRVGDMVYDVSIRGGLTQLANQLNRK